MPDLIIIDDSSPMDIGHPSGFGRGYVERDFAIDPPSMFAAPSDMPDMPFQEIADRIKEQQREESSLRHIRRRALNGSHIPALDQNGQGYCWAYSVGMTLILCRARDMLPYVRLSPHAVACKIMNFRNQGGWCGLSARFARGEDPKFPTIGGYPSDALWPQKSMSRQYDNAETWANAELHKIAEDFVDLAAPVYDQNLTKKQVLIQLVLNNPCACDWNWWGHSTCMAWATLLGNPTNPVLQDFGMGGINSWTDDWGDLGEFELRGSRSVPDGAVCTRVTGASHL